MYIRDSEGEAAFNDALLKPLNKYKEFAGSESDIPIFNVDMPNSREKGLILYAKGPYVLNVMAQEMGTETWKLFLRDIYKTFLGKIMTMDDFEKYINNYDTSGKSLALFKKLLNEKGLPE
jgi:aminopeptidase N